MNVFPDLKPQKIKVTSIKPVRKTEYGGGYSQVSLKATRKLKKFTLGFSALKNADADELEQFFDDNQAKEFKYTYPRTNTEYTVRFDMGDEISFDEVSGTYQSTQVVLKEV